VVAFAGVALGAMRDRRWLVLPALVTGFLLQHAVQAGVLPCRSWRLGFRTSYEIEEERRLEGLFAAISKGIRNRRRCRCPPCELPGLRACSSVGVRLSAAALPEGARSDVRGASSES
jgi:hypothetical protein